MRKVSIAVAFVVLAGLAAAASARPGELNGTISAERPYGTASLTWLFLTAYEASLWTDAKAWSMEAPFALSITYSMSFTREELVERTVDEMRKVSPSLSKEAVARFGAALAKAYPNVESGDRVTALHVPGQPVRFFHKGRPTTSIDEAGFAEPFFGIWLSPKTSEPSVRRGLLGLSR